MKLLAQELPSPRAIQETPSPAINKDPLIARNLQKEQYVGIFGLAIALIAAVGFLSRRIEYAIIFAMILSAILIAFFLFV
ncbi:hypothetical protein VF14_06580 [Nostoc linckia z18]|jgi:hypothetical protein|uniref:Uncharacterized protein n=1 Tax=Nostoc punctiforme FACHB-252 TaxID=1357509 RepID=A0ABR8HJA6_NOSPU|nr:MULTISPECIES: hypothetical protein [Nostoc]MBL1200229.1 hypothetical protein [Nostoc sp. GBBB01]MDZ8012049.1 hypothetical protein [Nostoc sp. ZfuVER08]MBD2615175.1 hypothetical protein [Nostoc punctiforme FACHB-252]PHJ72227.1 hypothetical protein VF05_04655 [Nostoc linckia z3]PHJ75667.1 hypothetical protein VF03_09460 [Nostoc linckia z2]